MSAVMATQPTEWPAARIWSGSRRVLVVDDDRDIRELLVELLGGEGYLVSSAADGRQALREAHAHRPDVILLDLMMPVMDGYQFRAAQLEDPDLAQVPVVIISAFDHRLEAAAVIQKPFLVEELLATVHRLAL
jgi:CheY-like chemotaxis protein